MVLAPLTKQCVRWARALALSGVLVMWPGVATVRAQSFVVSPFLQSAAPSRVWVVWQTSFGRESTVEWGLTSKLGNTSHGSSKRMRLFSRLHEVELRGLKPNTRYYYRVRTGSLLSTLATLRTPPRPQDEMSFRLLVMSDMQRDDRAPSKFREVIERGVLPFVAREYGTSLEDALGMVLIPGDLVRKGSRYRIWRRDFFAPSALLSRHVPLYPALGNHEENSRYYFDYFHLPRNGSPHHPEHWWWMDYSNVRIVALDTNVDYRREEQLSWLSKVLEHACRTEYVDFVVAQHHHPEKSELWPRGDVAYAGRIRHMLEAFATRCHKPTVQFFGHTHAYARGHSRDAAHTMVNVGSAGGNLDEFGEHAQRDYSEYAVSQADYGFVVMEVEAGADPQFRIRRISLGDAYTPRRNEVRDTVVVRRFDQKPNTPRVLSDVGSVDPSYARLEATEFSDPDGDEFGASHWQVTDARCDFTRPLIDRFYQTQNYFGERDTRRGLNPSDLTLSALRARTGYCYRVRQRDSSLAWSAWSEPRAFRTGGSQLSARRD